MIPPGTRLACGSVSPVATLGRWAAVRMTAYRRSPPAPAMFRAGAPTVHFRTVNVWRIGARSLVPQGEAQRSASSSQSLRGLGARIDHGMEVVGNENRRNPAEDLEGPDVRGAPVGELLGRHGLGIGVAACPRTATKSWARRISPLSGPTIGLVSPPRRPSLSPRARPAPRWRPSRPPVA